MQMQMSALPGWATCSCSRCAPFKPCWTRAPLSVCAKFFLSVDGSFPLLPPERQCPTSIAVAHGPERAAARAFERAFAEGEGRTLMRQQWADVRLDRAAWQLWQGEEEAVTTAMNGSRHGPGAIAGGSARGRHGRPGEEERGRDSSAVRAVRSAISRARAPRLRAGARRPSLVAVDGPRHAILSARADASFSLSSTRPFDALALHDPRRRSAAGLGAQQLRATHVTSVPRTCRPATATRRTALSARPQSRLRCFFSRSSEPYGEAGRRTERC